MNKKQKKRECGSLGRYFAVFIIPALAIYLIFSILPFMYTIFYIRNPCKFSKFPETDFFHGRKGRNMLKLKSMYLNAGRKATAFMSK